MDIIQRNTTPKLNYKMDKDRQVKTRNKRRSQEENEDDKISKQRRMTTKDSQTVVTDTGDFVLNHSNYTIINITDEKIENAEAWDRLTSPVTSDNHTEQLYPFRFSYMYAQRNDKFLMVTDDGKVTVNGDVKDQGTFFMINRNIMNNHFQIICQGGKCKNYLLYMDGNLLKSKSNHKSLRLSLDDNSNNNTLFTWKAEGTAGKLISVKNGTILKFNHKGEYSPTVNDTMPYFNEMYDNKLNMADKSIAFMCQPSYVTKITTI